MHPFHKPSSSSSSLGRSKNPNSRTSELSDPARKSFTVNPVSKRSSLIANSRTFVPTTPVVNTPTGSQVRNSVGGREVPRSFFNDHDENKVNGKDKLLKASKAQSSAASSKSAKKFMSPAIFAASKVAMPTKKKVLVERNEPSATSVPATTEVKGPIIRKVTFAEPLHCNNLKSENDVEQQMLVTSFHGLSTEEMHFDTSFSCEELSGEAAIFDMNSPFKSNTDTELSFQNVADEPDCVILDRSFKLSPTPTPLPPPVSSTVSTLSLPHADPLSPPYDPKTNCLSPRQQFLHYTPKPQMEGEGENLMFYSFSDTEATEDTQSEEGSQNSEEVSSDEVIKAEAGISKPSPARTSLAEETIEAREVPKPHYFMKSKTFIALLLLFSVVAIISVSITNSSVMEHTMFQDFYKVYESSDLSEYAKGNFDQFSQLAKAKFDVSGRYLHTWYTKSTSSISEVISYFREGHHLDHLQYYNLTAFKDLYKVYESSDLSEYAKANFDQFSQLAKEKFDVSGRYLHTWYTKSMSLISEVISYFKGGHHLDHLQYYNLTVFKDLYKVYESYDLSEYAKPNFDQFSQLAKAKFDVSGRYLHTWYTKSMSSISEVISNFRGGHHLGHLQYYNLTVLKDLYKVYASSDLFGYAKANFDQFSQFTKAKFDVSARYFYTWYTKSLSSISTAILNVREVYHLGRLQYYNSTVLQESNVFYQEPISGPSKMDIVEIEFPGLNNEEGDTTLESEGYESEFDQRDVGVTSVITSVPELEESLEGGQPATVIESDQSLQVAEVSESSHTSKVVVMDVDDQPSLDAEAADINSEVITIGNLAAKSAQVCDAVDKYSNIARDDQQSLQSSIAEILTVEAREDNDMKLIAAERVNADKYTDIRLKDQPGLDSDVNEIHTEDGDIELIEADGEFASIDTRLEDNEEILETILSPHLMLYLLLSGGTILIAAEAFKWSRNVISKKTNVANSVAKPVFAKAAFYANSLATPTGDQSFKPSFRNEPTEIDLHEELLTSEMSSIQNNSHKQKVVKRPTQIDLHEESHTLEMISIQKNSHKQKVIEEVNIVDKNATPTPSSSEDSISPSYGSFTTYNKIKIKRGHGEEETITPVRRSSRVRSKVTSPL